MKNRHFLLKGLIILSYFFILGNSVFELPFLPDNIKTSKELGLYLTITILISATLLKLNTFKKVENISLIDLLIFAYLFLIPILQVIILRTNSLDILLSISYGILYFCLRNISNDLISRKVICKIIVGIFIVQLSISIFQYLGVTQPYNNIRQICGYFFNPGPYAIYLSSLFPFLFVNAYNSFVKKQGLYLFISIVAIILGILVLLQLSSRTAFMAIIVSVTTCFIIHILLIIRPKKIKLLFIFTTIILIIGTTVIGLFLLRRQSVEGRILIWKATLSGLDSSRSLGIGSGKFQSDYIYLQRDFLNEIHLKEEERYLAGETNYAFNDYLQILVEKGPFGLLLFSFIIIFICYKALLFNSLIDKAFFLSFFIIVISGLTSYPFQVIPINMFFWNLVALLNRSSQVKTKVINYRFLQCILITVLCLFFVIFSFKTVVYFEWKKIKDDNVLGQQKFISSSFVLMFPNSNLLSDLGKMFFYKKHFNEAAFYQEKAIQQRFKVDYIYDLGKTQEKLKQYSLMEDNYKLLNDAIPSLMTPKYLLAKFYIEKCDTLSFSKKFKEIKNFNPKVHNYQNDKMKRKVFYLLKHHRCSE